MNFLAAEITAVTGKDWSEHYRRLADSPGPLNHTRIAEPAVARN
jgi:phosphoglucomutase